MQLGFSRAHASRFYASVAGLVWFGLIQLRLILMLNFLHIFSKRLAKRHELGGKDEFGGFEFEKK